MPTYYYSCEQDKKLIENSYNNISLLIFGKNNVYRIKAFADYFEKRVSQVNVYPQGTVTEYLNQRTPGRCRPDKDGYIIIEMLGYKGARNDQLKEVQHTGTHEFCHSFVDLLHEVISSKSARIIRDGFLYENCITKDGILHKNCTGKIIEIDSKTGELVGIYGKMFNETTMDIITAMAINCFDSNGRVASVDDILRLNFNDWRIERTGYSIFTSITRLAIAAFSNNGFINYQSAVDKGLSIFDGTTTMANGDTYKINDFLYGIVFDQLHIEEEFDKFMGSGSYKIFCGYLDSLFSLSLSEKKLPSGEVKRVMNILPDFLNKKINYYRQSGILDLKGADKIVGNFNQIWNSMQQEYGSYFTEQDINEIAKRAGII
ncbi:MAG: hypothetical protein K2L98_02575 [Bacilli bacterium]|nr:hypothetical protein [Bacilli bacterium]